MPVPCLFLLLTALPAQTPAATPHQFDFWIGDWEVRTPDGKLAGTSHVEAILDGSVLQEHWKGVGPGPGGTSFNFVDATTGKWRQFWVAGGGTSLDLQGGLKDGRMVLEGETLTPKGPQKERITWEARADGTVTQTWEQSTDGGKTWKVVFPGIYTRKK